MLQPNFAITPTIANALMRIEAAREAVRHLPVPLAAQAQLRETARLLSTHYFTMIEGNRLTLEEATDAVRGAHFPGRQRDEREVLGYYRALGRLEELAEAGEPVTEFIIRELHALLMPGGSH